ncbi:hypothetical protein TNCV_1007211 [Trichonephila clavipes]|nr:hypothetical protein TNCV_1007211 [Trichonephila clavipes]
MSRCHPLISRCGTGQKEVEWSNRRIVRHLGRNVSIRRFWQECVKNGRTEHQKGSSRARVITKIENKVKVRLTLTVSDVSTIKIQRVIVCCVSLPSPLHTARYVCSFTKIIRPGISRIKVE